MMMNNRTTALVTKSQRVAQSFVIVACLLTGLGLPEVEASSGLAEDTWFLLEFAGSKPPCANVAPQERCVGTMPRVSRFEIRDGERIEMPGSGQVPPAWAEFNRMWVYAPAVAGSSLQRSVELAATPLGARLIIQDEDRQYLQSVELNQWVALEHGSQPKLWVRVSTSQL